VGNLVQAGAGTELFQMVQNDPLRVYVNVPQSYVRSLKAGLPAEVQVAEFPGRTFLGKVARLSGAIDTSSRTLLTEVDIPNPKDELYAGMFGQVRFRLAPGTPAILLPANAAIVRAEGTLVAEVIDGKVKLQKVKFGRDFGTQIEILDGLKEGTQVILNPSDSLADGMAVEVVTPEAKPAQ
jgi:RND family efflux transporter MFP subunit